jgi:hypothetical protein
MKLVRWQRWAWLMLAAMAGCGANEEPVGSWASWPMPDSPTIFCVGPEGPIACPAPGEASHGQDGNYRIHVPAYDTSVDGIAVDSITGLVWQRVPSLEMMTWDRAREHCENLVLADAVDWRLPTRIELITIIDYGRPVPTIDEVTFPVQVDFDDHLAPVTMYWTSTLAPIQHYASVAHFSNGTVSISDVTWPGRARCVRSSEEIEP